MSIVAKCCLNRIFFYFDTCVSFWQLSALKCSMCTILCSIEGCFNLLLRCPGFVKNQDVYWWLYYSLNCVVAMDEGRLATRVMMLQLQKHFQTFPFRTECLKFNYKYVDLGIYKNKYREQRSKFTFLLPLQFSKNWNFCLKASNHLNQVNYGLITVSLLWTTILF